MSAMTTVMIVDDHEDFRGSARAMLESDGFHVVGEAGDGATALALARRLRPDLVVLDVQLPDMNGFQVAELLVEAGTVRDIVMISSREASDYIGSLARTRARGFISKMDLSCQAIMDILKAAS